MYKILLVRRGGSEPLYTPYKVEVETDGVKEKVVYETDSKSELEATIKELLETIPRNQIMPVEDLDFIVDVLINEYPHA